MGLLSATRSGLLLCILSPRVPGRLIPQFLQVSANDEPPGAAVPVYAPIPGPAIEDGKDEHVNAEDVSICDVKDEEGLTPGAWYGRGVAAVDSNPPSEVSSVPPAPARCRNILSGWDVEASQCVTNSVVGSHRAHLGNITCVHSMDVGP